MRFLDPEPLDLALGCAPGKWLEIEWLPGAPRWVGDSDGWSGQTSLERDVRDVTRCLPMAIQPALVRIRKSKEDEQSRTRQQPCRLRGPLGSSQGARWEFPLQIGSPC